MKITLYSNNCPRCKVLERKFDLKNIEYEIVSDEKIIQDKGFHILPVVEFDGEVVPFRDAIMYANTYKPETVEPQGE